MYAYKETTINKNPLKQIHPTNLQLYPKLKSLFTMALPYPNENTNHHNIFITFKALIPYLIFCSIISSFSQYILHIT